MSAKRNLALPAGDSLSNAGVAAFVQDRRSAEVLQVLMLPACPDLGGPRGGQSPSNPLLVGYIPGLHLR